jgi:hypothetical protein
MTNQNNNPFVLPGLGQSGELAQNPLLASMEMMRQAWQGMAGSGSLAQSTLATPMTLEDLERRIADLRTVENWLRMNLSMLSSTIQGLEVQRATIATIKSFIATPAADSGSDAGASPLEIVLGLKPSGQAKIRPVAKPAAASGGAEPPTPDALATTAGWWSMLQKQFDTLASATAATMQGAEAMQAAATEAAVPKKPSHAAPSAKTAVKSSASKATAKTAAKAAPRKRAASAPKKTRP